MKNSVNHDFYFKKLLGSLFPDFIQLFLPNLSDDIDPSSLSTLDKELLGDIFSSKVNQADLVIKARSKSLNSSFLIHVEAQSHHQQDFPLRFYNYYSLLRQKYRLPVYPIVIFSFKSPRKPQPSSFEDQLIDLDILKFSYRSIQLNLLDWQDYIHILNPVAAALIPQMHFKPGTERFRVKLNCMALLRKLNRDPETNHLVSAFIDTYLPLSPLEQEQYKSLLLTLTPSIKEAIMELETSWKREGLQQGLLQGREQGLQQGLEQGREQGLQQGMSMLLVKHLTRRFGNLPQDSINKLHTLNSDQLLKLNDALFDFSDLSDLITWLAQHG